MLTRRAPDEQEQKDIVYGRAVARAIAGYDLGQTVVIAGQACVAVEAMEVKVKRVISRPQMRIPAQMVAMAQPVVRVRMASSSRKD